MPPHQAQAGSQVEYILYSSTETRPLRETQLSELLATSQAYNAQYHITGLLCYSQGHFVQLIEGPPAAVRALFARIRRDERHHHLVCLRHEAGPTRWFPDWRMALLRPDSLEFHWLINHLQVSSPQLPPTLAEYDLITDPNLLTLLHAFSPL